MVPYHKLHLLWPYFKVIKIVVFRLLSTLGSNCSSCASLCCNYCLSCFVIWILLPQSPSICILQHFFVSYLIKKKFRTAVCQYVSRKSCCVGPWVKGFHSKESAGKLFAGRRGGSRLLLHSTLGQCNYTVVQSGGGHAIVVVVVRDPASVFTPKGVRSRYSVSTKEIPTF